MEPSPALRRMDDHLRHWQETNDHRAIFLECYRRMTGNMLQAVAEQRFHDCTWVNNLLEHFAEYYFRALMQYEQTDANTPEIWSYTHHTTMTKDLHVLQHLLLGINAHINYDLVLTLDDALRIEWGSLSPDARHLRMEDHFKVNQIIAETIDIVQDEVVERYSPVMRIVDVILGRTDERLMSSVIASWRSRVWDNTMEMLALEDPLPREEYRAQLETHVLHTAKRIVLF